MQEEKKMSAEIIKFPRAFKPPASQQAVEYIATPESEYHLNGTADQLALIGPPTFASNEEHIQYTLDTAAPLLFQHLHHMGFNFAGFQDEDGVKIGAFAIEAIHSLLAAYYGGYHPFQTIAAEVFKRGANTEFDMVKEIHVKFKQPEDVEQSNTA